MYYGKYNNKAMPDVISMLSSLVRLMSCYLRDQSPSQIMTLVHLMNCLENHPDLPDNPTKGVAVQQGRVIWREELMRLRLNAAAPHGCGTVDDEIIH